MIPIGARVRVYVAGGGSCIGTVREIWMRSYGPAYLIEYGDGVRGAAYARHVVLDRQPTDGERATVAALRNGMRLAAARGARQC